MYRMGISLHGGTKLKYQICFGISDMPDISPCKQQMQEASLVARKNVKKNTVQAVFCFLLEFSIPGGPEYTKYQHYMDVQGTV